MGKLRGMAALSLHGALALVVFLMLTGCGGSTTGSSQPQLGPTDSWPLHGFAGAARSAAFAAVAVDSSERQVDPLTSQLLLDVREEAGETLVRILGSELDARREIFLHLSYDSAELHPTLTRNGRWMPEDSIFLGITNQPGLVVLGLSASAGRPLTHGTQVEIAAVRFAQGGWQQNRGVSAVANTAVSDLHFDSTVTNKLVWSYSSTGDYDQNSEVGISDITPIGIHLRKTNADGTWNAARCADGDGNGEVNLADLQPIGANYRDTITGYQVKGGSSVVGPFSNDALVAFDNQAFPIPTGGGFRQFEHVVATAVPGGYYCVVPVSGTEESSAISNVVQYGGTLSPPHSLSAAQSGLGVLLTWQAPLGGTPDGYNCYVSVGSNMTGATKMNVGNGDVVNLQFGCPLSIQPTGSYYFGVKAVYGGIESPYSNIFGYNITGEGAPTNLLAVDNGGVIRLTWDAPAQTPDGYNCYVGTDAALSDGIRINLVPVPSPFDCPLSVDPAQEHYFGVKSVYGGNESAYSNIYHYTVGGGGDTTPPVWQQGTGIKAATPDAAGGMVMVSWYVATDAQSPPVEYLFYVVPDGTPIDWNDPAEIFSSAILSTPVTTLPDGTPFQNGQRYQFAVRARDSASPTKNVTTNVNTLYGTPQILPPANTLVPPSNPLNATDTASVRMQGEEVPRMAAVNRASNLYYVWWNNTLTPPDWTVVDLDLTIGVPGRKYHPQMVGVGDNVHLLFATNTTVYEAYGPKDDPANWQTKIIGGSLASNPGITGSALFYSAADNYLACVYSGNSGGEKVFYSDRDMSGDWSAPISIMDGNPEVWQCDMTIDDTTGEQWVVAANGRADSNGDLLKFWTVRRPDRASAWGTPTNTTYGGDVMTIDMDYTVSPAVPVVACAEVRDIDTGFGMQPVSDATIFTWTGNAWGKDVRESGFANIDMTNFTFDVGLTGQDPQLIFSPSGKAIALWSNLEFFTDLIETQSTLTGDWRYSQRPGATWSPPQSLYPHITSSNSVTAGESFQHCVTCDLGLQDGPDDYETLGNKYSERNNYVAGNLYFLYRPWS